MKCHNHSCVVGWLAACLLLLAAGAVLHMPRVVGAPTLHAGLFELGEELGIIRSYSSPNACVNNLRQIDGAKEQWAMATNASTNATPTWADIDEYIKGGSNYCTCPADPFESASTSYRINDLMTDPVCLVGSTFTPAHTL